MRAAGRWWGGVAAVVVVLGAAVTPAVAVRRAVPPRHEATTTPATFELPGVRADEVRTFADPITQVGGASCPSATVCYLAADVLRRSDDGGRTWSPRTTPFGGHIADVACTTVDRCLAVDSGGNALVTVDGGGTWSSSSAQVSSAQVSSAHLSCPTAATCYAAGNSPDFGNPVATVAVTRDGGATWRRLPPLGVPPLTGVSCPTELSCRVVAPGSVLRTDDGGASWSATPSGSFAATPSIACPTVSVCVLATGADTTVWRSTDGAATFPTSVSVSAPVPSSIRGVACLSATVCVVAGGFGVDGGTARIDYGLGGLVSPGPTVPRVNGFTLLTCGPVHCLALGPDAPATRTGQYVTAISDDGGASFAAVTDAGPPTIADVSCGAGRCLAIGQSGVANGLGTTGSLVEITDDAGATWRRATVPNTGGPLVGVTCGSASVCVATGQASPAGVPTGAVLRSGDGGETWSVPALPIDALQLGAPACPTAAVCLVTAVLSSPPTPSDRYRLLRSIDGGATWAVVNGVILGLSDIGCTPSGCLAVGVQPGGAVVPFTTTDLGATWQAAPSPSDRTPNGRVRCTGGSCLVHTFDQTHFDELFRTTDLGATWTPATGRAELSERACAPDGTCVAIGNDVVGQVATSADGGASWSLGARATTVRSFGRLACVDAARCLVGVTGGAQQGTAVWRLTLLPPTLRTIVPGRLYDSRPGSLTADGAGAGDGRRPAGGVTVVTVAGRAGVTADATSAVLTVTVTDTVNPGFLTVWPCDAARPTASSLNYGAGVTVANTVVAKLAADGTVCIYHHAATDLVVDVVGFLGDGAPIEALVPARALDTRPGSVTSDGLAAGDGLRDAGGVTTVQIGGRAGVPLGTGSAVLTVTVTDARGPGFLTVWPCDAERPTASSLNFTAGATVANTVVSRLAADGTVCIYHHAATHLVVDVVGTVAPSSTVHTIVPERMLDSRADGITIDSFDSAIGARAADSVTFVQVAGRGHVPSGARSVILTVTVTQPTDAGYLTVWPCDAPRPTASSLNHAPGATVANTVISRLAPAGTVCIYHQRATHLVVDAVGYE